jgi:hypothetical protein
LVAAVLVPTVKTRADAVVFYARDEALHLAFPDAEKVEARDFFLTAEQRVEIERRAKSKVESDLVTVYVGHREGRITGYAFIDTHQVRTLPETFMVVLDPKGQVSPPNTCRARVGCSSSSNGTTRARSASAGRSPA